MFRKTTTGTDIKYDIKQILKLYFNKIFFLKQCFDNFAEFMLLITSQ